MAYIYAQKHYVVAMDVRCQTTCSLIKSSNRSALRSHEGVLTTFEQEVANDLCSELSGTITLSITLLHNTLCYYHYNNIIIICGEIVGKTLHVDEMVDRDMWPTTKVGF